MKFPTIFNIEIANRFDSYAKDFEYRYLKKQKKHLFVTYL